MKIYVVTEEDRADYELYSTSPKVFTDYEEAKTYAKKQFELAVKDFKDRYDEEELNIDCSDSCYSVYLNGYECSENTYISIFEAEVLITEYDFCKDRIHECRPKMSEKKLNRLAEDLANDDYAWENFDIALGEMLN